MNQIITALLIISLTGCAWFQQHKAYFAASAQILEQEALAIATQTVYSQGLSVVDTLSKNWNVAGFATALRQLEGTAVSTSATQIPDAIMQLRQLWLGPQDHYTALAAKIGTLVASQHPTTNAQATAVIEAVIKGLQAPAPALVGP